MLESKLENKNIASTLDWGVGGAYFHFPPVGTIFWLAIEASHGQRIDRTVPYAPSFLRMYHDPHLKRARLAAYFFQYRSHDFCQN